MTYHEYLKKELNKNKVYNIKIIVIIKLTFK